MKEFLSLRQILPSYAVEKKTLHRRDVVTKGDYCVMFCKKCTRMSFILNIVFFSSEELQIMDHIIGCFGLVSSFELITDRDVRLSLLQCWNQAENFQKNRDRAKLSQPLGSCFERMKETDTRNLVK